MTETTEHRRFTENTAQYVAATFTQLQQGSGILAIFLLVFCALTVATTAGQLNPAEAVYQAGLAAGAVGSMMIIGWGASRGHSAVCTSTAAVADEATAEVEQRIDKLEEALGSRLDEFETRLSQCSSELSGLIETEREAIAAVREMVGTARDELTPRRSRN